MAAKCSWHARSPPPSSSPAQSKIRARRGWLLGPVQVPGRPHQMPKIHVHRSEGEGRPKQCPNPRSRHSRHRDGTFSRLTPPPPPPPLLPRSGPPPLAGGRRRAAAAPAFAAFAAAALLLASAPAPASAWSNVSVLVVRVSDQNTCPSINALCGRATPVYLDEINVLTGATLSSTLLQSVTLAGNDPYVGAISRCANGRCAVFGAQNSIDATAPTTTAPFFSASRTIVRIGSDNTVVNTTKVLSADYNGLFKGVCSLDGTGYWLAGNATSTCISYVADGTTSANVVSVTNGAGCTFGTDPVMHGMYTGCQVAVNPTKTQIYFARTYNIFGFIESAQAAVTQPQWSQANSLLINGVPESVLYAGFLNPWYMGQVITNYAQDTFWAVEPNQCAIVICRGASSIPNLPVGGVGRQGCYYLFGGTSGSAICAFSGLTLSPDESMLYFSSRNTIYSLPSQGGQLSIVTTTGTFNEYRGIVWAPQSCSAGGASPQTGYYCPNGANSALVPCAAGTYSFVGATTSCLQCPGGTYSTTIATVACTGCDAGIYCPAGSTNNSAPCPPGYYCPAGASPQACSAGIFCPGGSTTNTVTCPAGSYCPGGGAAPVPCGLGTASAATGASTNVCSSCSVGTYAAVTGLATCTQCPWGTYNGATGSNSLSACFGCSQGYFCPPGSSVATTQCPAGYFCGGSGRNNGPCPSGTFSATLSAISNATCLPCAAGVWCPEASTNGSTPCIAGWSCPGGRRANAPCGPGFYQPNTGQSSCIQCVAGSLSNIFGATKCDSCPAGTYSEAGSAALTCTPCPSNTYSPNPGAGSRAFCIPCPSGYVSRIGATSCSAQTWTRANPPFPLTGRRGGLALSNASAMIAAGGRTADGSLSDIVLGVDARTGQIVESRGVNISFDGAAVAPHPQQPLTYVFGGVDASGRETANLWLVSTSGVGLPTATQVSFPASPAPTARKLSAMAWLPLCPAMTGGCLVLIGGERAGLLLGDVWTFDLAAGRWSQPTGLSAGAPTARSGHAVAIKPEPNSTILFVFGGTTAAGASSDLFALAPFGFTDATPAEMVNVALNMDATMSGNDALQSTRGPRAAVDGILITRHSPVDSGNPFGATPCSCNYCALTPKGPTGNFYGPTVGTTSPWWGVDLGAAQQIDFLYIYMREPAAAGAYSYDFPFGKSAGARIYASNSNSTPSIPCPSTRPFNAFNASSCPYTSVGSRCPPGTVPAAEGGCVLATSIGTQIPTGGPSIYATPGLNARYLWITLPGLYRILSVCEFQAFQKKPWVWRLLSGTYNAALGGKATQSSTLSGWGDGQASRAVDGLISNRVDGAQPYTFSHTRDGGDAPITWWQVDMGTTVDVLTLRIFARSDCCTVRNTNIRFYIGMSTDYRYNTLCTNSPTDLTPTLTLTDANQCVINSPDVVTVIGAPRTACYKQFSCPARGRYLQAIKTDANALAFGEVQAFANKLIDSPAARTGMAVSTYAGCMVLFGGADRAGFRNNEVRFFDMLNLKWLPVFDPIGTPPVSRASAFFSLLPPANAAAPSNVFGLFGGFSNTDQLNDVMTLTIPACPALDASVGFVADCYQGGTVCYITCPVGFTSMNGNSPVVCQTDGSWRGTVPPCQPRTPDRPTAVTAVVDPTTGAVTVAWNPPVYTGYYNSPGSLQAYNVRVGLDEIFESFANGKFPAPIGSYAVPGVGWDYVGGNWYSLLPKVGPNRWFGFNPALPVSSANLCCTLVAPLPQAYTSCCSATNGAVTMLDGVTNMFDFWQGYLRLDSDYFRFNLWDQHDNMVLFRDWPASVNPAAGWAIETYAALDTTNIVTAPEQAACLGVLDISDYQGRGAVEWSLCLRHNGAAVYQIQLISTIMAWPTTFLDTTPFVTTFNKPSAAYLRIEYIPEEYPTVFRAYWKLNAAEVWIKLATFPSQLQMRGGPINPANFRPALLMRNGNTQIRGVALFSYFRIGPLACASPGTERFVSSALTSARLLGLTQGSSYTFTVAAQTLAGWGPFSDPSARVTIPSLPSIQNFPLISQGRPCILSSVYSNTAYPCELAVDGILSTFSHSNALSDSNGGFGFLTIDLGVVREISFVRVIGRQDCCQDRLNNFQLWVSSNVNFVATGARCDPARIPTIQTTLPGFTAFVPCFATGTTTPLTGRFLTLRRDPLVNNYLNVAEIQVYGVADKPLVSQNKPCSMSSSFGINTCSFALDGRADTYAQNNNNAIPTGSVTQQGWLTVDLGVATAISSIKITARGDAAAQTLNNFRVWAGELPNFYTDVYNFNTMCNQSYLPRTLNTLPGNTSTFKCIANDGFGYKTDFPAIGRYVTLQTTGTASFSVAEFQIFSANWVLASFNKPCRMSSSLGGRVCGVGLNGVHSVLNEYAATATANDPDNFFTVDLGFPSAVRAIKVIAFPNPAYNLNFEIYVGDSSNYHLNVLCPQTNIPRTFSGSDGWALAFGCPLTGRYVTLHAPINNIVATEFQVFTANACPPRTAIGATALGGAVCTNAGYGQVCTHVCDAGSIPVSGSASSTCNGEAWDKPALVCAPTCPDLIAPPYSASCTQTLFTESFNLDGALTRFVSLDPYVQRVGFPTDSPPAQSTWFQLDGMLQASSLASCASDLHLVVASQRIYDWGSGFTLSARVSTSRRAGLVFRAIDKANLMRFYYDVETGVAAVERVVNGFPFIVSSLTSYIFATPNIFHSVSISVLNSQINVTYDGNLILSTSDRTFLVGAAGVYAQSSSLFDDLTFSVACQSCTGMTDSTTCTFSCQDGLIAVGPLSRSCVGTVQPTSFSPPLGTAPLYCTLPAPTFLPATLFILENSIKNANVGDPLVAFSSSPDYQVQFQITAAYQMGAYLNPPNFTRGIIPDQTLFWVDACSGQVKLRTGGRDVMDYEGVNNYILTVRAFIQGFAGAETIRNITVVVLNLDEAPVAVPTAVNVVENTAAGADGTAYVWNVISNALVGTMQQWDPENSTVLFRLDVDGAAGSFVLNSTSGEVRVAAAGAGNVTGTNVTKPVAFNFETSANTLTLSVSAIQVNDTTLSGSSTFVITLVDANDPPIVTAGQLFSLSEYADAGQPASVQYPVLAGLVRAYDEDVNVTWNNGTAFSLLAGAAAASACGQTDSWPTTDDTQLGATSLFTIDSVTGGLTLTANPVAIWRNRAPIVNNGQLLRVAYKVCVRATDVAGAFHQDLVTVNILADLPSLPYISSVSGTQPDPSTVGGTQIIFTGMNFMPGGQIRPLIVSYSSLSSGLTYAGVGCSITSNTTIACFTAPGFGKGYTWSINLGGQDVTPLLPLAMDYADPVVTSLSANAQTLPTAGNVRITLVGDNFGPGPQTDPKPGYVYNHSLPTVHFGNNGNEFRCTLVSYNHTHLVCTVLEGVGRDLGWTVRVGTASVSAAAPAAPSDMLLSYMPPTITSVTGDVGVNVRGLDTGGSQKIFINGQNFGPSVITWRQDGSQHTTLTDLLYATTFVKFGGNTGNLLDLDSCTQSPVSAHTQITCYTVPGSGVNHRVALAVASQNANVWPDASEFSNVSTGCAGGLCYVPPTVTSISGPGAKGADTAGGQVVFIDGANFGPISFPGATIIVTYGHVPGMYSSQYTGQLCAIRSQTRMTCNTDQGVGVGLVWSVSISDQTALTPNGPLVTSYAAPQVFQFSGAGAVDADTSGGEDVVISGRNFGPMDAYTNNLLSVNYGVVLQEGGAAFLATIPFVRYIAAACSVTVPHIELTCRTQPGAGNAMDWKVVVDSQASANPTTSYHEPLVDTITLTDGVTAVSGASAADVDGGQTLFLNGDFFGPVTYGNTSKSLLQRVTYGAGGNEFVATTWEVLSEQRISVVLPPGIGENLRFIVTVADQASPASTGTFSYRRPVVTLVDPPRSNTYSPYSAPTTITVAAKNLPLLDPTTNYRVTLGQGAYAYTTDLKVPRTPVAISAQRNADGSVNGTFALPKDGAGWGLGVTITISQGSYSNIAAVTNATADNAVFSYTDPDILSVIVTRALFEDPAANVSRGGEYIPCPAWPTGGWSCTDPTIFQLTVIGTNFGEDPAKMDRNDGVLRRLEMLYGGIVWSGGSPGAPTDIYDQLYLQSWSHDTLVAFVHLPGAPSGTLRLGLTTRSTWLQPTTANYLQTDSYVFSSLNPTISDLVGTVTDIPTTGGLDPVSITVDGLAGAADFKIFVGGDHTTGTEAIIVCPTGGALPDRNIPCPSIQNNIIIPNPSGVATVTFYPPMGEGANQAIIAVAYTGSIPYTPKQSAPPGPSSKLFITYRRPSISGFSLMSSCSVPTALQLPSAVMSVPTDGSTCVQIIGSNFGTNPEIAVGDGMYVSGSSSITRCDPPGQNHTCLQFRPPAGEGDGLLFPEYTFPLRVNPPYGYVTYIHVKRGQSSELTSDNRVQFSYDEPNVTSVVSSTGTFPTEGGVSILLTGINFGEHNPARFIPAEGDPLGVSVVFRGPDGSEAARCLNVTRMSHTAINCTLPEGSGSNLRVIANVAGKVHAPNDLSGAIINYAPPVIARAYTLPAGLLVDPLDPLATANASANVDGRIIVPGVNSDAMELSVGALGGEVIAVEGVNFGKRDPTRNCVFLAWRNRDASSRLKCDGYESFLGEGEVSSARVLFWSHRLVVFVAPPGIGFKEVVFSIGGSELVIGRGSPLAVRLTYAAPSIASLNPSLGPTEGRDNAGNPFKITIEGANFGPTPRDFRLMGNRLVTGDFIPASVSLDVAPTLPTAYLVVVFHSSCVSLAYSVVGAGMSNLVVQTANGVLPLFDASNTGAGCSQGFDFSNSSQVTFQLPAGVGANKNISVSVVDAFDSRLNLTSSKALFSYRPPFIKSYNPTPLLALFEADTEAGGYVPRVMDLDVYGNDFGNYELADVQNWSPLERSISLTIGSSTCLSANDPSAADLRGAITGLVRKREVPPTAPGETASPTTIVGCSLDFRTVPVGVNNISITIAGQTGFRPSWTPALDNETSVPQGYLVVGCGAGSYAKIGEVCRPCPAQYINSGILPGAVCVGYINNKDVPYLKRFPYPRPSKGWYNLNSSDANTARWGSPDGTQMTACPPGFQDGGRDVCIVPCDPPESCLTDNLCAYGYASKAPTWKCTSCDIGFYRQGYTCVKCPDSPWALVIGFTMLVIFAGVVGYFLNQKGVNIAVVSIGLDFFQVLAIFATSGVKWPPVVKELLHILSAFNLNIEIVAPECIVPDLNYKQKFWFIMLLPLSVGGLLLGGVWTGLYIYKGFIMGQSKRERKSHTPALVSSVLALLYILYLYLTRTIFDVFTCNPTYPPDGRLYLNVANKEQCGIPGGTQVTLLPYAVAGLIVYSFGYPAYVFFILWKNREMAMLDQVLRAKGVGEDRLSNPHAFDLRQTYGRTYFQFKPDWIFWTLAIILRKFCIAITAVVFSKNSSFQMAACLLVMFLAYSAHVMVRPYMGPAECDAVVKEVMDISSISERNARIRSLVVTIESRGRKKVRRNLLTSEGKIDSAAIIGVLAGWFFNYNTIEQIMIFCAVIVCLMGIMYQANSTTAFYPGALDGVTAVVMITIIFAIIYYFTVVITEMVVLYNEDHARKRARQLATRGGAGSAKKLSADSPKGGSNSGRLVGTDGEINTGKVDTQMNPLFLSKDGALDASGSTSLDSIMGQRVPPTPAMWVVIQQSYADLYRQVEQANERMSKMKKDEQRRQLEREAGVDGDADGDAESSAAPMTASPISPKDGASRKKSFAPKTTSDGGLAASDSLGSYKRAASMRSQRKMASS
jgi:hypothetical protein